MQKLNKIPTIMLSKSVLLNENDLVRTRIKLEELANTVKELQRNAVIREKRKFGKDLRQLSLKEKTSSTMINKYPKLELPIID